MTTCSPGGATVASVATRPPLRAVPPRPVPWLRDVVLRHAGDRRWRLTWRTARPAHGRFSLLPFGRGSEPLRDWLVREGRGRTRFAVTFSAPRPVVAVTLSVGSAEWGDAADTVSVNVSRSR